MKPLTLGLVPYLNILPLLEGLDEHFPEENRIRATPRELAALLAAGEVDIAVVSTFEGLRSAHRLRLIPGAGICSHGPVRSVQIFSKVPPAEMRSVLLDRASLSSSHLAQVVTRRHLGIVPEFRLSTEPFAAEFDWRGAPEDAFLAIGDTALRWEGTFPHALDLGQAWKEMTGLPFVYAGWFVREGVELSARQIAAFAEARARGERRIGEIVARLDPALVAAHGGAESLCDYLGRAIHHGVGDRELAGLEAYRAHLLEAGLLASDTPELRLAVTSQTAM